jgi:Zn-dependent M28 family amino/carboxypeptidase
MRSWNVVGDLRGQRNPEKIVMLGCHYDGHDITQGAVDPISGAVAVMEAARVLVKYSPELPRTVRFVLWGVEELGLLGSREYVKVHADEMSDIQFYLNLDSAGAKNNNRDVILNEWPELEPVFGQWAEEMALEFAVGQSISAHSDHFPFLLAGVPTGALGSVEASSSGRGYGHTRYDTVDKVDLTSLREAAAITARLALRIASDDAWPVERRDASAVQELLDTPDNREEQEFRDLLEAHYEKAGLKSSA